MKIIPLSQRDSHKRGLTWFTLVDDEDFEYLNQFKWQFTGGYATRYNRKEKKGILMHREIMDTPKELVVDHIDRDKLNNQKINLRNCTNSDNAKNSRGRVAFMSKYKGVFPIYGHAVYNNRKRKYEFPIIAWATRVYSGRKQIILGEFNTQEEAAILYNNSIEKYAGKYAYKNEII